MSWNSTKFIPQNAVYAHNGVLLSEKRKETKWLYNLQYGGTLERVSQVRKAGHKRPRIVLFCLHGLSRAFKIYRDRN